MTTGPATRGADSGAFQIFANQKFWAIDPLYPGYKLTANYNTMLFKGVGQLGEQAAFGSAEALRFEHYPEIVKVESCKTFDMIVGDVAPAYHPALGLKRFRRHLLFIKPDILLIADEVILANEGMLYNFPPEKIQTTGGLEHAPNDYIVGPEGEAFVEFDGVPGRYQIMAVYLDNQPGAGRYSFELDGKRIDSWTSSNQDLDDHLIAVSPEVQLDKGSRIAFRAAPMAVGCRLVKMAAFSRQVVVPQGAEWLMHLDPGTEILREADRVQASLGSSRVDFYSLAPTLGGIYWDLHAVKKPNLEPFTFRQTRRIILKPAFTADSALVLVLIRPRPENLPPLKKVEATLKGHQISVRWVSGDRRVSVEWDLEERSAKISL